MYNKNMEKAYSILNKIYQSGDEIEYKKHFKSLSELYMAFEVYNELYKRNGSAFTIIKDTASFFKGLGFKVIDDLNGFKIEA